jgi:hypothetical protein
MCLVAIAPSISRWLVADQSTVWVEACGEPRMVRIIVSSDPTGKSPQTPATGDAYCPYCVLVHQLPFVPPLVVSFAWQAVVSGPIHLANTAGAPITRQARRAHPPRAPPVLS